MGTLVVETKFFPLMFLLFLFRPVVELDGEVQRMRWGRTELSVEAGSHQLDFHVPYFWVMKAGKANAYVEVPAGGSATVTYKAPLLIMFMEGKTDVA